MADRKFFVFRNLTIEPFFVNLTCEFSGYGDIAAFPKGRDYQYVWFYLLNPSTDSQNICEEIKDYYSKIELIRSLLSSECSLWIFTLQSTVSLQFENSDFSLRDEIYRFNQNVYALADQYPNVKIIDFYDFVIRIGIDDLMDWKYYYLSQLILNPKLVTRFQNWFQMKIDAIDQKRKKCLVLDLDNTLWGGILGEDGLSGIQLGGGYPGNAFLDFQRALLQAYRTGIILTVCSKNNEADVLEVWEKHRENILNKDHFIIYKINWDDKYLNIKKIAEELNLGLSSFVFLDDNPIERDMVKSMLPEVQVPDFPTKPYLLRSFFEEVYRDYFQVYSMTQEDKNKAAYYRANIKRGELRSQYQSVEDYIASLGIELTVKLATHDDVCRVAQLTQKTNQFNLTTLRLTENDILSFMSQEYEIFCLSVRDRFGDSGLTGLAIIRFQSETEASIEIFLLSCRILGRGIEAAFLRSILNRLLTRGVRVVTASYVKTAKNEQTSSFFENQGFELTNTHKETKFYAFNLVKRLPIQRYFVIKES